MNKISDLKVGDLFYTKKYGKFIVCDKGYRYQIPVVFSEFSSFAEYDIDWQKTTELNNKQMKELKIEVPQGFEIDKDNSTFEKIVFKPIENRLPMSVEEIPNRNYYIGCKGKICELNTAYDKNNLSTKERAEAFLALMQLVELRDAWNGDWKADYNSETSYNIEAQDSGIIVYQYSNIPRVLNFKSRNIAEKFAEQFKDLIETAKELL